MPQKRPRRPSPRHSPERAARRADRQATRRKLAVVGDLAATIHGVKIASYGGFMAKVREHAAKASAKPPGPRNWYEKFAETDPAAAAELYEAAIDWSGRGEVYQQFCGRLTSFHKFVVCTYTQVGYQAFCRWLESVRPGK